MGLELAVVNGFLWWLVMVFCGGRGLIWGVAFGIDSLGSGWVSSVCGWFCLIVGGFRVVGVLCC